MPVFALIWPSNINKKPQPPASVLPHLHLKLQPNLFVLRVCPQICQNSSQAGARRIRSKCSKMHLPCQDHPESPLLRGVLSCSKTAFKQGAKGHQQNMSFLVALCARTRLSLEVAFKNAAKGYQPRRAASCMAVPLPASTNHCQKHGTFVPAPTYS